MLLRNWSDGYIFNHREICERLSAFDIRLISCALLYAYSRAWWGVKDKSCRAYFFSTKISSVENEKTGMREKW